MHASRDEKLKVVHGEICVPRFFCPLVSSVGLSTGERLDDLDSTIKKAEK